MFSKYITEYIFIELKYIIVEMLHKDNFNYKVISSCFNENLNFHKNIIYSNFLFQNI